MPSLWLMRDAVLALCFFIGAPWLLLAAGLLWWETGFLWPPYPGVVVATVLALTLEGFLWRRRPRRSPAYSIRRLILEVIVLMTAGVALGPVPGLVFWQGAVGFDAAVRVRQAVLSLIRVSLMRIVRIAAVIGLLWLPWRW